MSFVGANEGATAVVTLYFRLGRAHFITFVSNGRAALGAIEGF